MPRPPVEAAIALSIVLVAVEVVNARRGKPSLAARWPWLIAFCFGLLHGFGFAGALAEVGLPHHAIPVALLFFNLGVEIGQLVFVAAILDGGRAIPPRHHASPRACPGPANGQSARRDRGLRDRCSGSLLADGEDIRFFCMNPQSQSASLSPIVTSGQVIDRAGSFLGPSRHLP